MPAEQVDGMDVARDARGGRRASPQRVRAGDGPAFLEAICYRFRGHSMADPELYRDKDEVEALAQARPDHAAHDEAASPDGVIDDAQIRRACRRRPTTMANEAARFAEESPNPPLESLHRHVYKERGRCLRSPTARRSARRSATSSRTTSASSSWARTSARTAARTPSRRASSRSSAPQRVKDTPIAESVIVGAGIGAAMAGLKPMVELMTINFSLLAIDQIVNNASKLHYMSNGQINVPLVIRMAGGAGSQLGAQHSHSLESLVRARARA